MSAAATDVEESMKPWRETYYGIDPECYYPTRISMQDVQQVLGKLRANKSTASLAQPLEALAWLELAGRADYCVAGQPESIVRDFFTAFLGRDKDAKPTEPPEIVVYDRGCCAQINPDITAAAMFVSLCLLRDHFIGKPDYGTTLYGTLEVMDMGRLPPPTDRVGVYHSFLSGSEGFYYN